MSMIVIITFVHYQYEVNHITLILIIIDFIIEGDPMNYMTYFRRAAVYLALGRSKSALPDLDQVIELRPDFTKVICSS